MKTPLEVRYYPTQAEAVAAMAREGADCLRQEIEQHGQASLVLTGGSAPGELYRTWARDYGQALDWTAVHLFWGDERRVPHAHAESNVTTAAPLFGGIQVDPDKVHSWKTELEDPDMALADMRRVLAKAGVLQTGFTLTLLGMGPDGHVASLFPGHPLTKQGDAGAHLVAYLDDSPKPPAERFTFTFDLLNQSQTVYLLPFGESKRDAFHGLLAGDRQLPVTHIEAQKQLIAWTDLSE